MLHPDNNGNIIASLFGNADWSYLKRWEYYFKVYSQIALWAIVMEILPLCPTPSALV